MKQSAAAVINLLRRWFLLHQVSDSFWFSYRQFNWAKNTIVKLFDDLDQNSNTSFERDIVCEEEDSFLLSTENMKALQSEIF